MTCLCPSDGPVTYKLILTDNDKYIKFVDTNVLDEFFLHTDIMLITFYLKTYFFKFPHSVLLIIIT